MTEKIEALINQLQWDARLSNGQYNIRVCPFCNNNNYKFYINAENGLWDCKVCGEQGNLYQLKEKLNVTETTVSLQSAYTSSQTPDPIPNVSHMHYNLLNNEKFSDVLDYLVADRSFSIKALEQLQIGVALDAVGQKWISYPYFNEKNECTYVKYRTAPPSPKGFKGLKGRENPLYNIQALNQAESELIMVEGEADTVALISHGITNVVGIPGANMKKADWIERLDSKPNLQIYLLYDNDSVGQKAAKEIAIRIGLNRCKNICLPEFGGKDINEWFTKGFSVEEFSSLKESSTTFKLDGVQNAAEILKELKEEFEGKGIDPTIKTPWESVNRIVGGFEWGDLIGFMAEGKAGKAQPLTTNILSSTGWWKMKDAKVGLTMASEDGQDSYITGIFPQGKKEVFKVTFSDGRSTECCGDHLWKVGSVTNFTRDGYRVVDTTTLNNMLTKDKEWFIPLFSGDYGYNENLPINAWLLGALLGDGGLTCSVTFTKDDPIVVQRVRNSVTNYACVLNNRGKVKGNYVINGSNGNTNHILNIIRDLKLFGKKSTEKHIPQQYLEATREVRLELLQGLMDTDGSCEGKYNTPCFNTSSKQLAEDVCYLARSLGGIAKITDRIPKFKHKGVTKTGEKAYRILIKIQEPIFKYSLKAEKECIRKRDARLTVVSIKSVGYKETQCIAVSHPSKLYVTDNFTVTHNTTTALNLLDYLAFTGYSCFLYCNEMKGTRMIRKWVSKVTQTDDTPGSSKMGVDAVNAAMEKLPEYKGDLLFGYTSNNIKVVFETIRQAVKLYGVKVVCFDNLQLLVKSEEHATQETSNITKKFKELAMELGILIILIIQPKRVKEGAIVSARDAYGSSAIEKDVDCMLCFHRNRVAVIKENDFVGYTESAENFEPMMLVRADLTRYAPGGSTTLYFDGATSTVKEISGDMLNKTPDTTGVEKVEV